MNMCQKMTSVTCDEVVFHQLRGAQDFDARKAARCTRRPGREKVCQAGRLVFFEDQFDDR